MTGARILIAEDEAVVAEDLADRLRAAGFDVVGIARNPSQILDTVQRDAPDLVIMDIRLDGEMDGIEAAEAIRDRHGTPVIYLSAYGYGETLERAKKTEPYAFLNKPFDERELIVNIHIALYRHHAARELDLLRTQLQSTLKQVATLRQLIPMCRHCKKIRMDDGYWQELDVFLNERAGLRLTHGYCPKCSQKILEELEGTPLSSETRATGSDPEETKNR